MPCTYSCTCNHATSINQQSQNKGVQCADTQQSTNPQAAPPPTQPPTQPVVYTETKTTGQVSSMFKYVLSNDISININTF